MKVEVEWLEDEGVAHVSYADTTIETENDYREWIAKLRAGFDRCRAHAGGKFPLVVCIEQLSIAPRMRDRYGQELAAWMAKEYASVITRYGKRLDTRGVVATQALKRVTNPDLSTAAKAPAYDANLFATKAKAIAYAKATTAHTS